MPILLAGKRASSRLGVTLIEMMVVMLLLSLLAALTYPGLSAGIESLRISGAASATASFLNGALNRAERRQHGVEISILPAEGAVRLASAEPGFARELLMPEGVTIFEVLPRNPSVDPAAPRRFLVYPGGTVPRIGVVLVNRRGDRRIVSVDPITGVPRVERPQETGS